MKTNRLAGMAWPPGAIILILLSAAFLACGTSPEDVKKGDCVKSLEQGKERQTLPVVDCSEPHEAQILEILESNVEDYPGELALDAQANNRCPAGATYFDIPNEELWDSGFHKIFCYQVNKEGTVVSELTPALQDALRSANLAEFDLQQGIVLDEEIFYAGEDFSDIVFTECEEVPVGLLNNFGSEGEPDAEARGVILSVQSAVFFFTNEEAAKGCFA